jgi:hypothetical protein
MGSSIAPPAPVRRIVTGHSAEGKGTIIHDDEVTAVLMRPEVIENTISRTARIWTTKETPADNSEIT